MNVTSPPALVGLGLFPLTEAAQLAQLDVLTARRWALGYTYRYQGEKRESPGVMPLKLPALHGERDLTFTEMLTLRLVRAFRDAGLSLPTIKKVAKVAAEHYDTPLPFVSRRFRTDGRKVFIELHQARPANEAADISAKDRRLIDVLTGQENFADVVEPSLFANVEWAHDLAAKWWPLSRNRLVMLDPSVIFGAPHIAGTRIPTATIAAAVRAEGGSDAALGAVADWYGLAPDAVKDAQKFETEWLQRAA